MHQRSGSPARLLFSADEDFLPAASAELREAFPDANLSTVGPDLGGFVVEGVAIAGLARACRAQPSVFVRHLFREVGSIDVQPALTLDSAVKAAIATWVDLPLAATVSLQVWASGTNDLEFRTDELWHGISDALAERSVDVARGGREQVLSACVTEHEILFGLNSAANALSDWPGGRVRLSKPKAQISRSEFKLEELFRIANLDIPTTGVAIDLGASPGGWTRILRQRGLVVWAIDPAALDRRLLADPDVHHVRTTAGPFLATTDLEADLVVNDMRMSPDLSAQVMIGAARSLKAGGTMIQTLKITPHSPLRVVRDALAMLADAYEITFAHQLHHNRNEVTVVGRRRTSS